MNIAQYPLAFYVDVKIFPPPFLPRDNSSNNSSNSCQIHIKTWGRRRKKERKPWLALAAAVGLVCAYAPFQGFSFSSRCHAPFFYISFVFFLRQNQCIARPESRFSCIAQRRDKKRAGKQTWSQRYILVGARCIFPRMEQQSPK